MATSLVEARRRGADPTKLTEQQQAFVFELLMNPAADAVAAARKAGYKSPAQVSNKMLKNPIIAAILGREKKKREERCRLSADEVLNYLRIALFFNPLDYFKPTKDGKWLIDDPESIPEEIGRLIEKMEIKVTEDKEGNQYSFFQVELVSKTTALGYALKHTTVDKSEVIHKFDWDALLGGEEVFDTIEAKIIGEEKNG
jgi:phage terminase small subunit